MIKTIEITNSQSIYNAKHILGTSRYYNNALIASKSRQSDNKVNPDCFMRENTWSSLSIEEITNIASQFNAISVSNDMPFISRKRKHGYILEHQNRWSVNRDVVSFKDFDITLKISKHSRVAKIELYYNRGAYYISIETIKNKRPRKAVKPTKSKQVASNGTTKKSSYQVNFSKYIDKISANSQNENVYIRFARGFRFVSEKQAQAKHLLRKLNNSVQDSKQCLHVYDKLRKLNIEAHTLYYKFLDDNSPYTNTPTARFIYAREERRKLRKRTYFMLPFEEKLAKVLSKTKRHERAAMRVLKDETNLHGLKKLSSCISNVISERKDDRFIAKIERKAKKEVKGSISLTEFKTYLNMVRKQYHNCY